MYTVRDMKFVILTFCCFTANYYIQSTELPTTIPDCKLYYNENK